MPKQRYTTEQIVAKLRQVDVALAQGQSVAQALKPLASSAGGAHRAGLASSGRRSAGPHAELGAAQPDRPRVPTPLWSWPLWSLAAATSGAGLGPHTQGRPFARLRFLRGDTPSPSRPRTSAARAFNRPLAINGYEC